jgi:hypothetical protein
MEAPQIRSSLGLWKLFDSRGNELSFNYHKIRHKGEHLPSISQAVPAVWLDRVADRRAYIAIRRWISHAKREYMHFALLAAVRCLPAIAHAKQHGGDPNGDYMGVAIEAAFDEINRWPTHDPGYDDEIDFFAELSFLEPPRPAEYRDWLTYYYMRWLKRAARRAIKLEIKDRKRSRQPPNDFDRLWLIGRTQKKSGTRYVLAKADSRDPSQLAFDREIDNEIDGLHDWTGGAIANGWLADWLEANLQDPADKEIVRVKMAAGWRTHQQIIEVVNASLGTHYTHDKASKCLRRLEQRLKEKFEKEFGFRPTKRLGNNRATGTEPTELSFFSEDNEIPIGAMQAAAQYELDEDGYKIGPKILHVSPNSRPSSPAKSA